jgi:hypothetical protein
MSDEEWKERFVKAHLDFAKAIWEIFPQEKAEELTLSMIDSLKSFSDYMEAKRLSLGN